MRELYADKPVTYIVDPIDVVELRGDIGLVRVILVRFVARSLRNASRVSTSGDENKAAIGIGMCFSKGNINRFFHRQRTLEFSSEGPRLVHTCERDGGRMNDQLASLLFGKLFKTHSNYEK